MNTRNIDCYYFYYSTCTKENCPYRHCKAALGTEVICAKWREGNCTRHDCKFRHMQNNFNRSSTPCYWENQPGGCLKPHCVFLHQKDRRLINSSADSHKLILPTPHSEATTLLPDLPASDEKTDNSSGLGTASVLVDPVVVSLNDGEESDGESAPNATCKSSQGLDECNNLRSNLENDSFGIKSLEQLRMEKIHRESEHFYKCDNQVTGDAPDLAGEEGDLRHVLQRKHGSKTIESNISVVEPVKRVISLKRPKGDENGDSSSLTVTVRKENEDSLNFQVKTLEEIRKEKKVKLAESVNGKSEEKLKRIAESTVEKVHHDTVVSEPKKLKLSSGGTTKPQIKRPSQEVYTVKSLLKKKNSPVKNDGAVPEKKKRLSFSETSSTPSQTKDSSKVHTQNDSKSPSSLPQPKSSSNVKEKVSFSSTADETRSHKRVDMDAIRAFIRRIPPTKITFEKDQPDQIINNNNSTCEAVEPTSTSSAFHETDDSGGKVSADEEPLVQKTVVEDSPACAWELETEVEMKSVHSNVDKCALSSWEKSPDIDDYNQVLLDGDDAILDSVDVPQGDDNEDLLMELDEMIKS